jgi:hypothetical protein
VTQWKFGIEQMPKQELREIRRAVRAGHTDAYMRGQATARTQEDESSTTLPSPEEIEAAKTRRGGWSRATLAAWGVPWPPPRGWRHALQKQRSAEQRGRVSERPRGWSSPMRVRFECPACGAAHPRASCGGNQSEGPYAGS